MMRLVCLTIVLGAVVVSNAKGPPCALDHSCTEKCAKIILGAADRGCDLTSDSKVPRCTGLKREYELFGCAPVSCTDNDGVCVPSDFADDAEFGCDTRLSSLDGSCATDFKCCLKLSCEAKGYTCGMEADCRGVEYDGVCPESAPVCCTVTV